MEDILFKLFIGLQKYIFVFFIIGYITMGIGFFVSFKLMASYRDDIMEKLELLKSYERYSRNSNN
jgi:hypothetical protein